MADAAVHLSIGCTDIDGVRVRIKHQDRLFPILFRLVLDDEVAEVAVLRQDLAGFADVLAVMAPEAAG